MFVDFVHCVKLKKKKHFKSRDGFCNVADFFNFKTRGGVQKKGIVPVDYIVNLTSLCFHLKRD